MLSTRDVISLVAILLIIGIIAVWSGCGGSPNDSENNLPEIQSFIADPQMINPSDTAVLSWQTIRTDSLRLLPPDTLLNNPVSGSTTVSPEFPTTYALIAYNAYGSDSETVSVSVSSVPVAIEPINGIYFKGIMGDTITDQPMLFAVVDCNGHYLAEQQIQLDMVTGDGILGPRSIMTDNAGVAGFAYCFSGNLANASFRLYLENLDTIKVYVRADALIPGGHGQAQYILFDDTYADVKNFNGEPASLDIITDHCIMYANYEESLGVVVMLYDLDYNQQVYDTSSVYGVIVNSVYSGTTLDNPAIGVLSPLADLRQLWGAPNYISHNPPRPATVIRYDSLPGKFYGHWEAGMTDTLIEEIHLFEPVEQASPISLLNLDTSQ